MRQLTSPSALQKRHSQARTVPGWTSAYQSCPGINSFLYIDDTLRSNVDLRERLLSPLAIVGLPQAAATKCTTASEIGWHAQTLFGGRSDDLGRVLGEPHPGWMRRAQRPPSHWQAQAARDAERASGLSSPCANTQDLRRIRHCPAHWSTERIRNKPPSIGIFARFCELTDSHHHESLIAQFAAIMDPQPLQLL